MTPRQAALASYVAQLGTDPEVRARLLARVAQGDVDGVLLEVYAFLKEDIVIVGEALGRSAAGAAVDAGAMALGRALMGLASDVKRGIDGLGRGRK